MERSLREMFAARAQEPPRAAADAATVAIRRARRQRRWRAAAGGLAGVCVLVGLSGSVVSLQGWWSPPGPDTVISPILPPPEPPEPVTHDPEPWYGGPQGVELRLVNRVWTADGDRTLLRGSALVEKAYRTPHGLLYGNAEEIRLRRASGATTELVRNPGQWLVSPDGHRVAHATGRTTRVAPVQPDSLGQASTVRVPEGAAPVAFWGKRIVLAGPDDTFGLWDPSAADSPDWTAEPVAVYGQAEGGLGVLVRDSGVHCFAVIPADAGSLSPEHADGCRATVPLTGDGHGWLNPTGDWLAVPTGGEVQLLPVGGEPADAEPVTCPRTDSVQPVWQGSDTLLTADETGVVSCTVRGDVDRLGHPDGLASRWEYVQTRGGTVTVPSPSATFTPR